MRCYFSFLLLISIICLATIFKPKLCLSQRSVLCVCVCVCCLCFADVVTWELTDLIINQNDRTEHTHRALTSCSLHPPYCLLFLSSLLCDFVPFSFDLFLASPSSPSCLSSLSLPLLIFFSVHSLLSRSHSLRIPYLFLSLSLIHSPCRLLPQIEQQPLNRLTLQSLNNNLIPSVPPSFCLSLKPSQFIWPLYFNLPFMGLRSHKGL